MIPQQTWINEAVKDPALFQATLLPAAVHHALLHDLNLSESFELFQNTTRTVSTKLSDREQGISDTNLAAVVCLSFVEVAFPSIESNIAVSHADRCLNRVECSWE